MTLSPQTRQHLRSALTNTAAQKEIEGILEGTLVQTVPNGQTLTVASGGAISVAAGGTLSVAGTENVATGGTLTVTDPDALTVGGVKVPQQQTLVEFTVPILAGKTVYNLFVARDAWQVTSIDYVPDVAEGSTLTATAVKATGTATPASATTPLHTAAGINLNGTAHTVQSITLSSTTADLQLAVGDRIGFVLSGAMTTGSGRLIVRGKRI